MAQDRPSWQVSVSFRSSHACSDFTQTTGLLLQSDAPHIKEENTTLQNPFNSYIIIQVKKNAKGNKTVRNF